MYEKWKISLTLYMLFFINAAHRNDRISTSVVKVALLTLSESLRDIGH